MIKKSYRGKSVIECVTRDRELTRHMKKIFRKGCQPFRRTCKKYQITKIIKTRTSVILRREKTRAAGFQ